METPLLIRSPGKELRAEDECRDVLIEIEGLDFLAHRSEERRVGERV